MSSARRDRVGNLLQSGIAELLLRDVKDPRIGMVTVTGVDVSPDLKHARVYVAPHGDAEARALALAGLRSARPYLQAQVGRRLRLRFTPELRFELDDSLDRVARLEELLSGADRDDAESD
jgi:ribosome-binding factor A